MKWFAASLIEDIYPSSISSVKNIIPLKDSSPIHVVVGRNESFVEVLKNSPLCLGANEGRQDAHKVANGEVVQLGF